MVTACGYAPLGALSVDRERKELGRARSFVEKKLSGGGIDEDVVDTAVLLANELVTNAVIHTDGEIEIRLGQGEGVLVEVRDTSKDFPIRKSNPDDGTTGRGLALVEMMASAYGVRELPGHGKSVWFMLGAQPKEGIDSGWSDGQLDTASTVAVQLKNMSVPLYYVMTEHNDALLREFALYCLSDPGDFNVEAHEASGVDPFRSRFATLIKQRLEGGAQYSEDSVPNLDMDLDINQADVASLERVKELINKADELARRNKLLSRPALPELRAFRDWLLNELIDQPRGAQPNAWKYTDLSGELGAKSAAKFDTTWLRSETRPVVVADDTNHIIATSPAVTTALGWLESELVGQRIVAIIPPRLREAHVAGFTRHMVTSVPHILGKDLELPALHKSGEEVLVKVRLERRSAGPGSVFIAWIG
jgi:PAS domain S-box-containing protein